MSGFRAGAAAVSLEPPLGLPMIGFVRRWQPAEWSVGDLEASAVVVEGADGVRGCVVGIDTCAIQAPEVDALRERVAAAAGCDVAGVLLNFNHTHCAPPGSPGMAGLGGGDASDGVDPRVVAYMSSLWSGVVDVAVLAASRLEEALPVWGVGRCDESVNRRERADDGRVILGWNPDGIVDPQVPVLQLVRRDGSVLATVVTYGCHTVAVGPDVLAYSADYPGPLRAAVRAWTGGECVFLQGAGGNVLPRVAFSGSLEASVAMGRRLALAALDAVADRPAWGRAFDVFDDGSVTPFHVYRPAPSSGASASVACIELDVDFPLQPVPSLDDVIEERRAVVCRLDAAASSGASAGELNVIRYDLLWCDRVVAALRSGFTSATGPVSALRVGDGVFATGPGEVFAEIGLAVRERSPAAVTAYLGYTNGLLTYFPTAAAFPHGGYEPAHGNRSFGLPAQVTPEADAVLVRSALDAIGELWPDWPGVDAGDPLLATGELPTPPEPLEALRPGGE